MGIELRSVSGRGANGMGGAPSDEEGWLRGERRPLDEESPGRGSGMKQAPKSRCGENRREAESA